MRILIQTKLLTGLCASVLMLPSLNAQETVAPTTGETVGPAKGENKGDYNIVQSWELGYRFHNVGGDDGKYRSDVNIRNGVRLLSSYLTVNSKDGHGKYFDEIILTTQGLGNDPYESATLRIQKNKLYRYDMTWRLNEYYNPGLATAAGLHLENLTNQWQDHDVVLFPQGKFKIKAGYGHSSESGPALSTSNLFENQRGDIFTLFSDVKRQYNSYRLGFDADVLGIRLSVLRRWDFYKEDIPYSLAAPGSGMNPADVTTLSSFYRAAPIHGRSPGWLLNLSTEKKHFAANGRFAYTSGNGNFVVNESAVGTGLLGTENRQVITFGDARRPVTTGDLNLSFFPTERITVTNNTSVNVTRMEGNSFFEQFDLKDLTATIVNFQFLGVKLVTNSSDVHFHVTKKIDFFAGYRYANREINSIQSTSDPVTPFVNTPYSQSNSLNAGAIGMNWLINSSLRLHLETEIGRNDNPFTPIADRNYHVIDGRLLYRNRRKSLTGTAGYKQNYNNNNITLTSYATHSRNIFASGSWAAKDWVSLDLGYSNLHLDSVGAIAFFSGAPRATSKSGDSIYISNIHAANLGARFSLKKKADLYVGYNITLDAGDGRSSLLPVGTVDALLYNYQTFPLSFQSPLLRLTVPIRNKIKWNLGYQYYGYHEDFGLAGRLQNYHANTGYTSVLWAF